jgi:hypothetical protein
VAALVTDYVSETGVIPSSDAPLVLISIYTAASVGRIATVVAQGVMDTIGVYSFTFACFVLAILPLVAMLGWAGESSSSLSSSAAAAAASSNSSSSIIISINIIIITIIINNIINIIIIIIITIPIIIIIIGPVLGR